MTNIVILTGAGISAESGISTFRDKNGLWENHRFEDVAAPEAFRRDPPWITPRPRRSNRRTLCASYPQFFAQGKARLSVNSQNDYWNDTNQHVVI